MEIIELVLEFFLGVQDEVSSQKSTLTGNNILDFTREQKLAIMKSLFSVSQIDKNGAKEEVDLYDSIGTSFKISNDNMGQFIKDMHSMTSIESIKELTCMSMEQSIWYVSCLLRMVKADGKVLKEEMELVDYIVKEIYFPQSRYLDLKKQFGI